MTDDLPDLPQQRDPVDLDDVVVIVHVDVVFESRRTVFGAELEHRPERIDLPLRDVFTFDGRDELARRPDPRDDDQ